ncbi:MAG: PDZ domain-containing protein [Pseudomonadota bacterium]
MAASVRYRIVPKNPGAHLFEVTCSIDNPDPAGQIISLPTWIPGSYMIREFARNIVWLKASSNNWPITVEKIDKSTWHCASVSGTLTITYEIYAWDLSVRAAHLDETHGFFNGTSTFIMVHGKENDAVEVDIAPPAGDRYHDWQIATAMRRVDAKPYGFGRYGADNYDELIDHPVEMGTFTLASLEACGVPHDIAITGRHRADLKRLSEDVKAICEYQINLFGQPAPMDRYVFLTMAVGDGYGGLEHRASTALICSRDDLPSTQDKDRSEKYCGFLGLVSHEYFHTWNVKRIKPAAFLPYDLTRENYTRQLWAFEGITSYYDDLTLVRTGLLSREQYLATLAETITRVLRGSGRLKQSIADSSFDAWIKYYRQDENAPNAVSSYYTKGSLAALALDLTIRLATASSKSLDDVMRLLWQRYGSQGIGVPEGAIEKIADEVAGQNLAAFFELAVYGTDDLPLQELLAQFGVDLFLRPAESASDKGGKAGKKEAPPLAVLGAKTSSNGEAKLTHIFDGGAAQASGLSAGDVVIAVDGLKVSGANLDNRIASYPADTTVSLHVFRRDELMTFEVMLKAASEDTCYLKITENQEESLTQRRESWLSGGEKSTNILATTKN